MAMDSGNNTCTSGCSLELYNALNSAGLIVQNPDVDQTNMKKTLFILVDTIISHIKSRMEVSGITSTITPSTITGTAAGVVPGALTITPVVMTATIIQDNVIKTGLVS